MEGSEDEWLGHHPVSEDMTDSGPTSLCESLAMANIVAMPEYAGLTQEMIRSVGSLKFASWT